MENVRRILALSGWVTETRSGTDDGDGRVEWTESTYIAYSVELEVGS